MVGQVQESQQVLPVGQHPPVPPAPDGLRLDTRAAAQFGPGQPRLPLEPHQAPREVAGEGVGDSPVVNPLSRHGALPLWGASQGVSSGRPVTWEARLTGHSGGDSSPATRRLLAWCGRPRSARRRGLQRRRCGKVHPQRWQLAALWPDRRTPTPPLPAQVQVQHAAVPPQVAVGQFLSLPTSGTKQSADFLSSVNQFSMPPAVNCRMLRRGQPQRRPSARRRPRQPVAGLSLRQR